MKLINKLMATLIIAGASLGASAEEIVIIHTNDIHSAIDPAGKTGGVLERKVMIDSIRAAHKNVLLIDAGDAVQGTLYFNFFDGEVEYPLYDLQGYDIMIPGNHDFDNGMEQMAKNWRSVKKATPLTSYDFSKTPLKGIFEPYTIKKIAGKKIGFFAVNIDPTSLILKDHYQGMGYQTDVVKYANDMAKLLKDDKKCDLVVAVTHIGYEKENEKTTDPELAKASHDIDIIIGGHSHTAVDGKKFPSIIKNADGRDVLVAQAGKYGRNIGEINIDTDKLDNPAKAFTSKLLPVPTMQDQAAFDQRIIRVVGPYKHLVDSVNARPVGYAPYAMSNEKRNGGYANWVADYARWYGNLKRDSLGLDRNMPLLGLMNVGGVRQALKHGAVTEGQLLSTFPFTNRMVITRVKGADIIKDLAMAAKKGGEGISDNVRVVTAPDSTLVRVVVDNIEVDPAKDYLVTTINYITEGNDDFFGMAEGEILWSDEVWMKAPILRYVQHLTSLGLPVEASDHPRFIYTD